MKKYEEDEDEDEEEKEGRMPFSFDTLSSYPSLLSPLRSLGLIRAKEMHLLLSAT